MKISEAIDMMIELMDQVGDVEVVFTESNGEIKPTLISEKNFPLNGWGANGKPNGLIKRDDGFHSWS